MKLGLSTFLALTITLIAGSIQLHAGGHVDVRSENESAVYSHLGTREVSRSTGTSRDFSVEAVMAASIHAGHPAWLYIEAKSLVTDDLRVNPTNRPGGVVVEIVDAKGKAVPMTAEGRRTFAKLTRDWKTPSSTVRPGQYIAVAINLTRHFDLTTPGVYTLTVHMAPDYPGGQDVTTHTKPMEFRVANPTVEMDAASQR